MAQRFEFVLLFRGRKQPFKHQPGEVGNNPVGGNCVTLLSRPSAVADPGTSRPECEWDYGPERTLLF